MQRSKQNWISTKSINLITIFFFTLVIIILRRYHFCLLNSSTVVFIITSHSLQEAKNFLKSGKKLFNLWIPHTFIKKGANLSRRVESHFTSPQFWLSETMILYLRIIVSSFKETLYHFTFIVWITLIPRDARANCELTTIFIHFIKWFVLMFYTFFSIQSINGSSSSLLLDWESVSCTSVLTFCISTALALGHLMPSAGWSTSTFMLFVSLLCK